MLLHESAAIGARPSADRDLKSRNILLHDGTPLLSDFGLSARLPEHSVTSAYPHGARALTSETGTYRFMSPEVLRHEPCGMPMARVVKYTHRGSRPVVPQNCNPHHAPP